MYDYVKANIPDINVVKSDATYLLWIDCSKLTKDSRRLAADIRKKTGLYLSAGSVYGKGGERFLRLNIACPESVLKDGLERLKNGFKKVAAICAAPSVLAQLGLLEGRKATAHAGFQDQLTGAEVLDAEVVVDGNITTSYGLGGAIPFALELVRQLAGQAEADRIRNAIAYRH